MDTIIEQYFDGDVSAAQMAELSQWIQADSAHAERFMRTAAFYNSLQARLLEQEPEATIERSTLRLRVMGSAFAAAALIAMALTAWFILQPEPATLETKPAARPVATLVSTGDAIGEFGPLVSGQDLLPQMIQTNRGETSFLLASLTTVTLHGPVQMRLDSPMHVTLLSGIATFRCPPEARGFTVALPDGSNIVDLGTEFCVDANLDGSTEVWVYVGSTQVTTTAKEASMLVAGEGVCIRDGRLAEPGATGQTEAAVDPVVFTEQKIKPYVGGVHQDGQHGLPTSAQVFEDGRTLRLVGNAWKTVAYPYNVTPNTIIEAEVRVPRLGELQGMGFDVSRGGNYGAFQIFGSETIPSISREYLTGRKTGWMRVSVPVGKHYTGKFERLLFMCDDDVAGEGECWFRNVRVYERPEITPLKETQE
ncbi:hypothetical protein HED60_06495 [Planctomycetales bacterium ZRK34]|nr:hypothetical protein HED60_06495 [Planctomycetales bacterium ZRK34]